MQRSASSRRPRALRWCCRPVRPACCRTRIRRTCMSAARKARSAAILRWPMPILSSSSARAGCVRPIALASATSPHKHVININGDFADALHYNNTTALAGDISAVIERLCAHLKGATREQGRMAEGLRGKEGRMVGVQARAFRSERRPTTRSGNAQCCISQPQSSSLPILPRASTPPSSSMPATCRPTASRSSRTTEPAIPSPKPARLIWALPASALLASGIAEKPRYGIAFTGDGSFMMNPQILIDAVEHKAARHDRDLRQSPDGGDHRTAACAIWSRFPHQRFRAGGLCAACRPP